MARLRIDGATVDVEQVDRSGSTVKIKVNSSIVTVQMLNEPTAGGDVLIGKVRNRVYAVEQASPVDDDRQILLINRRRFTVGLERTDLFGRPRDERPLSKGPLVVRAPMSGRITSVNRPAGSNVESSESLLVLEAMKMENDVASPKKGTVREVYVRPGALVKAGDKLALID